MEFKHLIWTRRRVSLALRGQELQVRLDCLGDWTYHPQLNWNRKMPRASEAHSWCITHIGSGHAAVHADGKCNAKEVVEFLAAQWPVFDHKDSNQMKGLHGSLIAARERGEILFYFRPAGYQELAKYRERHNNWSTDRLLEQELIAALTQGSTREEVGTETR